MNMVAEGFYTTESVHNLAKEKHIDMPITSALYGVLFENVPLEKSLKLLMDRDKKSE